MESIIFTNSLKKTVFCLIACSTLISSVVADTLQTSSQYSRHIDGKLQGDIDQDGKNETIAWRKFASVDLGDYYQLLILDDDGSLLWRGPKEKNDGDPLVFFSLDFGVSMPELLIDFDHDGYMELLAPAPQSDVSPTYYRKLRWRGTYFEPLLSNALLRSSPESNRFIWKTTQESYGTWISGLAPYGDGLAKANITEYNKDESGSVGIALIRLDREGATVERWLKPLDKGNDKRANTYRARLSYQDHQNSRGTRLVRVKDILSQDRANFYKVGGDTEDQAESYFRSKNERVTMRSLDMIPVDMGYSRWRNTILYGTPLVEVTIYPNHLDVKILQE